MDKGVKESGNSILRSKKKAVVNSVIQAFFYISELQNSFFPLLRMFCGKSCDI